MFSFKVKSMCIIFEFVFVREHVLACSSFSHTPYSFYKTFYWFLINFVLSQYLSFPSLLLLSAFSIFPQKQSLKGKKNPFPQRYIYINLGMELKVWCCLLSHTVYPLVNTPLLISIHCIESLIWIEAPGFSYAVDSQLSLSLFLDIL